MGIDTDFEIKYFQTEQNAKNKYYLPQNIKPCVCLLLSKPIEAIANGGTLGRQTAGMIIATDLRDNSETEEQIKKRLDTWNRQNLPPLPQKEIKGILKQCFVTGFKGNYKYKYSCRGKYTELLQFEEACIGKELCNYFRDNYANKGYKTPPINYKATSWQYVLTPREQLLLFYVIPQLERLKKVYPGYPLRTNYRELNEHTGIDQSDFKGILQALMDYKLIVYTPGTPRFWEHKGTEIRRIIPPPKIPGEYLNKLKEFKQTIKKQRGKNGKDTTNIIPGQRNQSTAEA